MTNVSCTSNNRRNTCMNKSRLQETADDGFQSLCEWCWKRAIEEEAEQFERGGGFYSDNRRTLRMRIGS